MKLSILFLFFAFSYNSVAIAQHNYENPRTKVKRGLLEEAEKQAKKELVEEKTDTSPFDNTQKMSKGETQFCACERNYFLSMKRKKLYNRLAGEGVVDNDYVKSNTYSNHKHKSGIAMKRIRTKYEIDEEFDCNHSDLTFKKLGQYKTAIAFLVETCDIDIIVE